MQAKDLAVNRESISLPSVMQVHASLEHAESAPEEGECEDGGEYLAVS